MTGADFDPRVDLTLERNIRSTPERIWRAWTDPEQLAQWWVPRPARAVVDRLDAIPGGAFVTRMSEDGSGEYVPHTDGVFLLVEPETRLVFTNVIDSSWHPVHPAPVAMTAEIRIEPSEDGVRYTATVRHASTADRDLHERLGFEEGWGSVTTALAELVETERL